MNDKDIVDLLRQKGYRITPQRRAVIMAFLHSGEFLTAQQVLEFVKQDSPDVSLDTIYRNLEMLVSLGVLHEINTRTREGNVYELVRGEHHHHLVCIKCGQTECINICPVSAEYIEAAEEKGFKVVGHTFEFYGLCRECQQKKSGAEDVSC